MAHYAFIDKDNIVVKVITGRNEDDLIDNIESWEKYYEQFYPELKCIRTSYNAVGGKWKNPETNEITDNLGFRKNYAVIGGSYDPIRDAFISQKPEDFIDENGESFTFVLNEETCLWDITKK